MQFKFPSVLITVSCAVLFCMCLSLSYWQHQRAKLKQSLQDFATANQSKEPLDLSKGFSEDQLRWRKATVVGTYAVDEQFLIDNRVHNHQAGFYVITPLQLENDTWILVNRGWMKAPTTRNQIAAPTAVSTTVTVTGLLKPDDADAFELADDEGKNNIWQNLKIERWAKQYNRTTIPVVLLANNAENKEDNLVPVDFVPDYRAATSRGYRLQWLMFAVIIACGYIAIGLRKGKAKVKAKDNDKEKN